MKMTKKLVLAAVVLPLTIGAASAFAYGGKGDHKGPDGKCGGGFDRGMMRQLDLTDAQKDQLKDMREESKGMKRGQGNMEERQAHQAKVQALVLADTFDKAAANELASQMVEKQTERRVAGLERQHQMLSVLTPEQKEKFVELQAERAQKCSEKMQKRMNKDK